MPKNGIKNIYYSHTQKCDLDKHIVGCILEVLAANSGSKHSQSLTCLPTLNSGVFFNFLYNQSILGVLNWKCEYNLRPHWSCLVTHRAQRDTFPVHRR